MINELEEISTFFNRRADIYDEHMIRNVVGAKEAYIEIAKYIPGKELLELVDIGCGTGLELFEIFKKNPSVKVTGIDLSGEMLNKLREKYMDKNLHLHQGNYFEFDYGKEQYDIVVSCETLHHFKHEEKLSLYTKLWNSLKNGGRYIECDYMVQNQEEEDLYFTENERLRKEHGITEGYYHYDTPCTADNQIMLLKRAGFCRVEKVWQMGSTVILISDK